MQEKTAVILLNWNGKMLLEKYLPSVVQTCKGIASIYVADNGSSDHSLQWIKDNHEKDVQVIALNQNYGYAGGYNQVIEQINESKLVLLNTDVNCPEGWLQPLVDALDRCDCCMPKILSDQNREQFEYAGAAGGLIDCLGYPFCRGRIFNELESDHGQYNTEIDIFWASGACLAIRREAFINAGRFDESLFAHQEEIDLCWRMHNRGMTIKFVPNSTVFHLGGGTLAAENENKTYLNFRNNLCIIFKNAHTLDVFQIILIRLILDGIAGIRFIIQGKLYHMLAIVRAHFSFYRRIPKLIEARAEQAHKRKLVDIKGVYNSSIIYKHFFRRIKSFQQL